MVKKASLLATALLAAGCATVDGAATAPTGAGSSVIGSPPSTVPVVPAGPAGTLICQLEQQLVTIWCDQPKRAMVDAPPGVAILLRQGDAVRFGRADLDRICTVSFFAAARDGRRWAVSGDRCASAPGTPVSTVDGQRIGTVERTMTLPGTAPATEPAFTMPAIALAPHVLIQSTVTGTMNPKDGLVVQALGGSLQTEHELYSPDGRTLGGTPSSTSRLVQAGDLGAPVIADGKLVGVVRSVSDLTSSGALLSGLVTLDPSATLVLKE